MARTATIITLVLLAGCASVREARRPVVHHIVLCWLKEPGNAEHRRQIVEASRSFRQIPGVLDVRAGEAIESDRDIVDDSFDVAIVLAFADTERLAEYLAHPVHQKAKHDVLLPIVERIVVYDFRE